MNRKTAATAAVLVGAISMTACGEDPVVSGLLDDIRFKPGTPAVTRVVSTYERYCVSSDNGACRAYAARPVSRTVVDKPAKPARFCLELDNVNGDLERDDRWFRVPADVFRTWANRSEGTPIDRIPYEGEGC